MLTEPEVEERFGNSDRTILTLSLIHYETSSLGTSSITNLVTGDGAREGAKTRGIQFCDAPRTKNEIQKHLEIKSDRYIRQGIIQPLLSNGSLARTIPEKTSSSKQKYIFTKSAVERAQIIMDNNPVMAMSSDDIGKRIPALCAGSVVRGSN